MPHVDGKILHVGADRKIRFFGGRKYRDAIVAIAEPQPGLAQLIAQGVVQRIMRGAAIHGDGSDSAGALVANKCHLASRGLAVWLGRSGARGSANREPRPGSM